MKFLVQGLLGAHPACHQQHDQMRHQSFWNSAGLLSYQKTELDSGATLKSMAQERPSVIFPWNMVGVVNKWWQHQTWTYLFSAQIITCIHTGVWFRFLQFPPSLLQICLFVHSYFGQFSPS